MAPDYSRQEYQQVVREILSLVRTVESLRPYQLRREAIFKLVAIEKVLKDFHDRVQSVYLADAMEDDDRDRSH